MARANIDEAARRIREIYDTDFGGKRRGRFTLSRDNLGDLMEVANVHDKTIRKLAENLIQDFDLCLVQRHHSRFGVVHGRKVGAWRKVTKAVMDEYRRPPSRPVPSDDQDDDEADE